MTKLEREYAYGQSSGLLLAAGDMAERAVMYFDMGKDDLAQLFRKIRDELKVKAEKARPPKETK